MPVPPFLRLGATAAALIAGAAAQLPLQQLGRTHLVDRAILRTTGAVVLADLDGDSDPDLLVTDQGYSLGWTQLAIYRNDGTGRFTDRMLVVPAPTSTTAALAVGDLDGDGDADVVYDSRVLRNLGGWQFAATMLPTAATVDAALADLDGDLDLDLLAQNFTPTVDLCINDGTGRFTLRPTSIPRVQLLRLGDLDGDLDPDLVITPGLGQPQIGATLWTNDGTGTFTQAGPPVANPVTAVAIGDVDADGDHDVLLGTDAVDVLMTNTGGGAFTVGPLGTLAERTYALALHDADRDGDLDVLVGNVEAPSRLLRNDGTGAFVEAPEPLPGGPAATSAFAIGDVDGDGCDDVLRGCGGGNDDLLWGLAAGGFALAGDGAAPGFRGAARFVDVDHDGDGDLVGYGNIERLWRNDGSGRFQPVDGAVPADGLASADLGVGDMDFDGNVDLVLANDTQLHLYLGDGRGAFVDGSSGRMPVLATPPVTLGLADFDGDSDLDALVTSFQAGPRLFLNDGTGRLVDGTAGRIPAIRALTSITTLLRDFDADGAVDIYLHVAAPVLLLNDGTGRFRDASVQVPNLGVTISATAGDVDGDGDEDLVTESLIALNDGSANFTLAPAGNLVHAITFLGFPRLLDFDRDGDLDLVFTSAGNAPVDAFANDGSGRFTPRPWLDAPGSGELLAGDFDGDGDDDLMMLAAGTVLANGHRQLRAPFTPRAGHHYELVADARPGYGVLGKYVVLAFGWARTAIDVPPLGRWHVAGASLLPPVWMPPNTSHTLAFAIPAAPQLIGLRFLVQGLFVDLDGDSHFSGVVDDVIR